MKNQPIRHTGRHFLQIPGPTNVPDRVLHAIAFPTIDHRGPEFAELGQEVVAGMKRVFQTAGTVVIYPVLRHRGVGGGAGQHAVAGRPGADVRDRAFRDAVAADGGTARARCRIRPRRLAARRRSGAGRARSLTPTASTGSRRSASSTTRPRPASRAASPRSAPRSTRPGIRRCSWSIRFPRSARSTTGTTNGASMSRSAARRRG